MKLRILALTLLFIAALSAGVAVASLGVFNAPDGTVPGTGQPAATPVAPSLAFEGIVHHVGGPAPALWVVDNYPFLVITNTVIISHGLQAQPGTWARVEAIKSAGLQAVTLELQEAPTSDLYDRIEAIDENLGQWRVGQTLVRLNPDTVVTGASPRVGNLALVHGARSATGIDASSILVLAADAEVYYQGTLNAMEQAYWQVDDVRIELDATTVFSGAVPIIGSRVQARGVETGPQRIRATHLWILNDSAASRQITGWLQRIDGSSYPYLWRVNEIDGPQLRQVFLTVHEDTVVDETGGPATPGAWFSSDVIHQGGNVYRASVVSILARPPKRQIVAQVHLLPPGGLTGIWHVGAYRVEVSQATGIVGSPEVGAMVWVSGTPDQANVIQAQLIEVLGD